LLNLIRQVYSTTTDEQILERCFNRVSGACNTALSTLGSRRGTRCRILDVDIDKWIQAMDKAPLPQIGAEYESITVCSTGVGFHPGTLSVLRSRHKGAKEITTRGVTIQMLGDDA